VNVAERIQQSIGGDEIDLDVVEARRALAGAGVIDTRTYVAD
jgi:hypothetical protein